MYFYYKKVNKREVEVQKKSSHFSFSSQELGWRKLCSWVVNKNSNERHIGHHERPGGWRAEQEATPLSGPCAHESLLLLGCKIGLWPFQSLGQKVRRRIMPRHLVPPRGLWKPPSSKPVQHFPGPSNELLNFFHLQSRTGGITLWRRRDKPAVFHHILLFAAAPIQSCWIQRRRLLCAFI